MRTFLTVAVTVLISASALAAGDIYRWKDSNGTWHYSDQPQPGAELVVRGSRPVGSDSASPATSTPAPASSNESSGPLPVSDAVAAQVREEAAAAKSAQCKVAEDAYQKAIQARIMTKTDDAGNKVYMSPAEIDAYRLEVRGVRDAACGPGA